jgi:prefoldin subunit 5
VTALKKRVTELEQAQHDMAAVVAALQQQLGNIQQQMAAQAKSA